MRWYYIGVLSVLLALIPSLVMAEAVTLTLASAQTESGLLSVDMGVNGGNGSGPLTTALYLLKGSNCSMGTFLTWALVSPESGQPVHIDAVWPETLKSGNYHLIAVASEDGKVPEPCSTLVSDPVTVSAPQKISPVDGLVKDMSGKASEGPDYQVTAINLPIEVSRVIPGGFLSADVSIKNMGSDDSKKTPVQLSGFLGERELIPVTASCPPLKSGYEQTIGVRFYVPADIDIKGYPFRILVDPHLQHQAGRESNDLKRADGLITVSIPDTDERVKSCDCEN